MKKQKKKQKKLKRKRIMEVKKMAEEWKIQDKKEEIVKLVKEAKELVLEHFHKQIHIFGKKQSERVSTKKLWDYAIEIKERFVLRKRKVYLLSRKEKEEMHKFISK